jgi:hypothetical protein
MTTYYVGPGGNDANDGLTWATRKLTLNGAEDIPVAAGDTVYVGAGTYREMLTCDVSGNAGNPITYIGDYTGANTDGVGGVVRITGSDNDQTAARSHCIYINTKNYRTFKNFSMDVANIYSVFNTGSNTTIQSCILFLGKETGIATSGNVTGLTARNCVFVGGRGSNSGACYFQHSSTVDNAGHVVENCMFLTVAYGVRSNRIGGITVKNCLLDCFDRCVHIGTALSAGQSITVNNCIMMNTNVALNAINLGEIVEDYNTFYNCSTARTNVNVGANSNTYPPLFDSRWFFEMVKGGSMLSPFDLASYSQLVNLAGTSPTSTDMRGTSAIGGTREWGALEYDPDLKIEAGGGGGGIRNVPIPVFLRRRR